MFISLKTPEQISIMNDANKIVREILGYAKGVSQIGMTTLELDILIEERLASYKGATSAFKGYKNYPNVSCISVNEEVVHGIPSSRTLGNGDIVSVDFGVYYKGLAGDAAVSFILGDARPEDTRLVEQTRLALEKGIEQMCLGNRLYDINRAIENVCKANGYGNVEGFAGHAIGVDMHQEPAVFNYVETREPNIRLQEGITFALEPMFYLGKGGVEISDDDKWTVRTKDKSNAAHWELSVAVGKSGPIILGE